MRNDTILSIVQEAQDLLPGVPTLTALVSNTSDDGRFWRSLVHKTGKEILNTFDWPQLKRRFVITSVNGTASYAMPADLHSHIFTTQWDQNDQIPLIGPLTSTEWEAVENWDIAGPTTTVYRIEGRDRVVAEASPVQALSYQLTLSPTPASNSLLYSFVYLSTSWLQPQQWVTGTVYAAGSYVCNRGLYYYSATGGTAGGAAPTHASGSASDGGVTWQLVQAPYDRLKADTDLPLFDADLFIAGLKKNYLAAQRFDNATEVDEYQDLLEATQGAIVGARELTGSYDLNFDAINLSKYV